MSPERLIRDPRTIAGLLHSNRRDVHKDTVVKLRQDTQLTIYWYNLYSMFPYMYVWGDLRFATLFDITYQDYTKVKIPMFLLWWSKLLFLGKQSWMKRECRLWANSQSCTFKLTWLTLLLFHKTNFSQQAFQILTGRAAEGRMHKFWYKDTRV